MAVIRSYQRQVGASGASPARAIDTGESKVWGAVVQAVGTAANVVGAHVQAQQQLKEKQDQLLTATLDARAKNNTTTWEDGRTQKMRELVSAGKTEAEIQQEISVYDAQYDAKMGEILEQMPDSPRRALLAENHRYGRDVARGPATLAQYNTIKTEKMIGDAEVEVYQAVQNGNIELANQLLGEYEGIIPQSKLISLRKSVIREAQAVEFNNDRQVILAYERQYLETGDREEYMNSLDSILAGDPSDAIRVEVNSKKNSLIKMSVKEAENAAKDFNEKFLKGTVDVLDYARLKRYTSVNYASAVEFATQTDQINKDVSSADARQLMRDLNDFREGNVTMSEVIKAAVETGGLVGAVALFAANDIAVDLAKNQDDFSAFKMLFQDRRIKCSGVTADFVGTMAQYTENMLAEEDDISGFTTKSLKHLALWQEQNPDAKTTDKEYQDMTSEWFKPYAQKGQDRLVSPLLETGTTIDEVSSIWDDV